MKVFGKSKGGGRRKIVRAETPLLAVISTLAGERRVGIVNVSTLGVQLTSPDLPGEGETVMFRCESVQSFGRIVWSRAGQCGVAFDMPICATEVERLRHEAEIAEMPYLSFGSTHGAAA